MRNKIFYHKHDSFECYTGRAGSGESALQLYGDRSLDIRVEVIVDKTEDFGD